MLTDHPHDCLVPRGQTQPGADAASRLRVRRGPGSACPEMNVLVGASAFRVCSLGPGTKPPSRATSRGPGPAGPARRRSVPAGGVRPGCRAGWPRTGHSRGRRVGCWRWPRRPGRRSRTRWLAELALADRAGVRVAHRHQPVADRLPTRPLLDLGGHPLAAAGRLLQPLGGSQLGPRPPGFGVEGKHLIGRLAVRLASVLEIARISLPIRRERSTTLVVAPRNRPASLRPARASARAPREASMPSER
jgi:hypothetical protein